MNAVQDIREGQTIKVYQRYLEADKERKTVFMGQVTKVRGLGVNRSVTVHQTIDGVDVDRIFPLSSPAITKIEPVELKKKTTKKKTRKK